LSRAQPDTANPEAVMHHHSRVQPPPRPRSNCEIWPSLSLTMNNWRIPRWLEDEVRSRDKKCVYCGVEMLAKVAGGAPRKALATWEHIINDAEIVTRENIALCCASCNSSKGAWLLGDWIKSKSCITRGISRCTVAEIIRNALDVADRSSSKSSGFGLPI
jgi:hypothetical protein